MATASVQAHDQLPSWWMVLICCSIFSLLSQAWASEYTRPPPRPIVSTSHNRPHSHPQQVHISLTGNEYYYMRIAWITDDKKLPSLVEYGTQTGKYQASATGEDTSYRFFFYESGKIHHVKIGPLDPNTTYYYRCSGVGEQFNFKTPPAAFPLNFAVAGDLGQTEWTASTLAHIQSWEHDVLLLPGDLSYADNQQPLWDSFGRMVEPLASSRPWMVTQGNHEVEKVPIIGPHAFTSYNARWKMPFEESRSTSNLYYSFDVAGAHVVMLGSYANFGPGSEQYRWLEADLGMVDRRRTPWLVALIHAPWYSTNLAHQGEGEAMRTSMEEILYKARVNVVFAGHVHAYERFTRVYNNSVNSCGPVHVTIGDGGNREGLALLFETPGSPLSMFREASFGHGRFRIANETHAHWAWHRNDATESSIGDEIWIENLRWSTSCMAMESQELSNQVRHNHDEL